MPRYLFTVFLLAGAPALAAQSGWRFIQTTDEFTAATDARLVLREDGWPPARPEDAAAHNATLLVVCGHRIPGDSGRTLLLSADQPMQPFANLAYVEMRFDSEPQVVQAYFTTQQSDVIAPETGHRYARYVAYLGTERRPYYSPKLFGKLLDARRLRLRYKAFGRDRTASFHLAGLRQALAKLPDCHWNR